MKAILPVPMPYWSGGRLQYMWCTGCSWRYPIEGPQAEYPDVRTEQEVKSAFEEHDCASFPG
ncbi:MAG: hypothetical protein ACRD3E_20215 [Terriglobales bacterium]